MKRKRALAASLMVGILLASALLAWILGVFPQGKFASNLRTAIDTHRGQPFLISELTSFEWDRLLILPPYSNISTIPITLPPLRTLNGTYVNEGSCLFVFLKRGKIVHHLEFHRRYGDFAKLFRDGGYDPTEARFVVPTDGQGAGQECAGRRPMGIEAPEQVGGEFDFHLVPATGLERAAVKTR